MNQELIELNVEIEWPEADPEELDRLSHNLRTELLELGVASVELVSAGPPPERTKAVDWNLLGEWVVKLGVAAVPGLFALLKGQTEQAHTSAPLKIKVRASRYRIVELEYDPAHTTPEQLADLVKRLQQALAAR